MAIVDAEPVRDVLVGHAGQRLREPRVGSQREADLLERPAIDDRELMLQHLAGGHATQQLARRQARRQRVFAGMEFSFDAELATERAPVPGRCVRDPCRAKLVDDRPIARAARDVSGRVGPIDGQRRVGETPVVDPEECGRADQRQQEQRDDHAQRGATRLSCAQRRASLHARHRRPRESGDPVTFAARRWVPAFAGTTSYMHVGIVLCMAIDKPAPQRNPTSCRDQPCISARHRARAAFPSPSRASRRARAPRLNPQRCPHLRASESSRVRSRACGSGY